MSNKQKVWFKASNIFALYKLPITEVEYDSDPENKDDPTSHIHKGKIIKLDHVHDTILIKNIESGSYASFNSNEIKIKHFITSPPSFTWNTQINLLEHKKSLHSPIFLLNGFKWYIHILDNSPFLKLGLKLAIKPPTFESVCADYKVLIVELDQIFKGKVKTIWQDFHFLEIRKKLLQQFKQVTIKVALCDLKATPIEERKDDDCKEYKHLLNMSMKTINYGWKYKLTRSTMNRMRKNQGEHHEFFKIFAFVCCISFNVRDEIEFCIMKKIWDSSIYLFQAGLSCQKEHVSGICCLKDKNRFSLQLTKTEQLMHLDEIVIEIELKMYDIYHSHTGAILMGKFQEIFMDNNHAKSLEKSVVSAIWRIPSITLIEAQSICYGYCRNYCRKYIPADIIKLCVLFVSEDNDMDNIKGLLIDKGNKERFELKLEMFHMNLLKVSLIISSPRPRRYGRRLEWNLHYFHSSQICGILFHYAVRCKELNYIRQDFVHIVYKDDNKHGGVICDCLSKKMIEMIPKLESLTFELQINILDVMWSGDDDKNIGWRWYDVDTDNVRVI